MPTPARARKPTTETLSIEEQIRRRAYELYVQRGNQSGSELDDWIQAEEEILQAQEQKQQRKTSPTPSPAAERPRSSTKRKT